MCIRPASGHESQCRPFCCPAIRMEESKIVIIFAEIQRSATKWTGHYNLLTIRI